MRFSNKSTLFLCLVLMSVFVALPVIAHQPPAGQTFAESHDGVRNNASQTADELAAETGHSHTAVPMVSSVTPVNVQGAATAGGTLMDNARDRMTVLVNDADAAAAARVLVTGLTDADSDPNTPVTLGEGELQLRITFNMGVYAVASAGSAATVPARGATDLALNSLTVIATTADAAGVDVSGTRLGTVVVAREDPTPDDTATNDLYNNRFLVTIPVTAGLTAAQLPLSIYIHVAENAVYSATQVVNGSIVQGRGTAAYGPSEAISLLSELPAIVPTPDTTAPTVTITSNPASGTALPASGNLVFTFDFSEELAAGSFIIDDLTRTNALGVVSGPTMSATDMTMYTLTLKPDDPAMPVTVTLMAGSVTDMAATPNAFGAAVSATYTPPGPGPGPDAEMPGTQSSGVITIPAAVSEGAPNSNGDAFSSFVVVVRDMSATGADGLAFRDDVMVVEWPGMPDLERLFYTGNDGIILGGGGGGALILTESATQTGDLAPGTVGISEIMWGINASFLGEDREDASQWIELHNLNAAEAKVILSWKTGREITSDSTITGNLANPTLDVVTNFFNDRPGNARWEVPGNSGSSVGGADFVSMARTGTFSKLRRHENNAGKDFNSRYTRTAGAGNSRDGRNKGHWAASTASYLRLRTTLTDQTDVVYNYIGTPGRVNTFSAESQPHIRDSRTSVPSDSVIFNEVANRSNAYQEYEWIELRNVGDSTINLRNYLISMVVGKSDGDDKLLYEFPNSNLDLPAGEVILLVDTDPRNNPEHPLAVGYNVDIDDEDQVVGSRKNPVRYKVTDFAGDGLPDSGDFVLILRRPDNHEGHRSGQDGGKGVAERGKDDLDKIVDIAGRHPDLTRNGYSNAVSSTNLWPLRAFRAPNFNNNKFSSNIVRLRIRGARGLGGVNDGASGVGAEGNHNDHRAAWRQDGYTGIGYKLQAADSPAHGGTPGYHGNVRGKSADLAGDKVIISEIMLSQGSRGNLPQWIELYNPSKTHAVNLADNAGWRLVIENPDRAPIITINFKDKGNVKYIPPNSTVLIVSSAARDYGHDNLPRGTVFPNTRVLNAYTALRGETFELASRTSPLLNPKAFNLRLMDGKTTDNKPASRYIGEISDEVGNLDGIPRTNDAATWEYSDGMTANKERTSLIRIFDKGVARDGKGIVKPLGGTKGEGVAMMDGIDDKYSWVHASDAAEFENERLFVRHTWYGDESDFGTPGDRTGQVLPVELSFFRPTLEDGKVTVRWTTESELDNAGFNILRSETRNGEYKQVNTDLIQGAGTTGERTTYNWVDPTAKPGVVYYYQIEDVSFAGERQALAITKLKGLISADGKLTTTWSELKQASQ